MDIMDNRNEFDLKPVECLTVKENYVSVYSRANKEYRYYCLNGKHITTFTEEQFKYMLGPACIFLDNRILVRGIDYWTLMDYDGNKIEGLFVRDVVVAKNTVLLIWPDSSMAVYSSKWELLLSTSPEYKFGGLIANRIVVVDYAEGRKRLYDLRFKKFVGSIYKKVEFLYSALIVYPDDSSEKCYLFNALTAEFEGRYDACFVRGIPIESDLYIHSIWVYRDGRCGLWFESESFVYQILPTGYTQISVDADGITARCKEKVVKFDADNFPRSNRKFNPRKRALIARADERAQTKLTYRGVEIKEGEELYFLNKCFFVSKSIETLKEGCEHVAKFYTLDGKYIADSGYKYDIAGKAEEVNFIDTPYILILGDNHNKSDEDQHWRSYYYTGERVIPKVFKEVNSDFNRTLLIFNTKKRSQNNEMYFFSYQTGKQLFKLSGYKSFIKLTSKYVFMRDYDENVQAFDRETGAQMVDHPISPKYYAEGDLIFEHVDLGYNVYDCRCKKEYFITADETRIARSSVMNDYPFIAVYLNSKAGIYDYSEEHGPYEIVPVEYDVVEVCDNCIRAQRFSPNETDDIYSFDGKLISTTSK